MVGWLREQVYGCMIARLAELLNKRTATVAYTIQIPASVGCPDLALLLSLGSLSLLSMMMMMMMMIYKLHARVYYCI